MNKISEQLRLKFNKTLPVNWHKGLECPECRADADRPKCMLEHSDCPRLDPSSYEISPYQQIPDAISHQAADIIDALADALRAAVAHPTPGGGHLPWMTQANDVLKKMEAL